MRHIFWTTRLRSCKVTISFYDYFVVAFAFTLITLLSVCFKVIFGALSRRFKRICSKTIQTILVWTHSSGPSTHENCDFGVSGPHLNVS